MFDLISFGETISDLRIGQNLTQQELADLADVHRTYVSDIERGKRNITVGTMIEIADALQISMPNLVRLAEAQYEKNLLARQKRSKSRK